MVPAARWRIVSRNASSTCSLTVLDRDHGRESVAPVVFVVRLCAAIGAASPRSAGHRTCASHLRNDPLEAPRTRRPCDGLGQAHQDRYRLGLSVSGRNRSRACQVARSTRMSVGLNEGDGTARTTCVRDDLPRLQLASPYCDDAKELRYGRRVVPKASATPRTPSNQPSLDTGEISASDLPGHAHPHRLFARKEPKNQSGARRPSHSVTPRLRDAVTPIRT